MTSGITASGEDASEPDAADNPTFQLTLQLGHVSMITGLALARHGSHRYILSADRDEHLRVSRYLPQAHVIEAFCLGHSEFISALAIPTGYPDILVSAGGDPGLFVWDCALVSLDPRWNYYPSCAKSQMALPRSLYLSSTQLLLPVIRARNSRSYWLYVKSESDLHSLASCLLVVARLTK